MELKNAVVFITGANRGLGLTFDREALARGARKVYAAARDPSAITLLTKGIDAPKSTPQAIVTQALDALEAGEREVLADERTRQVKQGLSANPAVYL